MTSPEYCTNKEFTKSLSRNINRPARLILPKIFFSLLYGSAATVVTGGQAVVPDRLIKAGFQFNYHYVNNALEDIVN